MFAPVPLDCGSPLPLSRSQPAGPEPKLSPSPSAKLHQALPILKSTIENQKSSISSVKSAEYQSLLDSLPYGKRLPGAVYLLDPGTTSEALPSKLRVTVAELRKHLDIGPDFKLLKFHTASPKISFLAYPAFDKDPHPALAESIIIDLVTGKIRRDDYRGRETPSTRPARRNHRPRHHPGSMGTASRERRSLVGLDGRAGE